MAVFGSQEENHPEEKPTNAPAGNEQEKAGEEPKVHDQEPEGEHKDGAGEHKDEAGGHKDGAGEQHHEGEGSHDGEHAHEGDHGHGPVDVSTVAARKEYFLNPDHLIEHVMDSDKFEFPSGDGANLNHIGIWNPLGYTRQEPLVKAPESLKKFVGPVTLAPTKFVVLELIAAVLIAAIFIPYARRVKNGDRPKGKFWNFIDVVVCYVKEQIAEPAIGKSDAKRFLPLVWTIFFFVLFLNLFGMIPGVGSATGSISITVALAMIVFGSVVYSGSKKMGLLGFWLAQVPHMDLPFGLGYILVPMIWLIEVFGLFVKHVVLAVRLFANMFAGHLVLAVFVAFVGVLGYYSALFVGPAALALNMLELMVAFIQAYVFAFLSALFIGAAIHPH